MYRNFLFIFVLLLPGLVFSQKNLVPNPGFELYDRCPENYGAEDYIAAKSWVNYHFTPDYFHRCADFGNVSVPENFFGYQEPAEGNAYIGFLVYKSDTPNELIGAKLLEPLKKGEKYLFRMKLSLAEAYSRLASDNVGILFTNQPEQALNSSQYHYKSDQVIIDSKEWTTLEGVFYADADYSYIMIGNFFPKEKTEYKVVNPEAFTEAAYYYIDDVSVVKIPKDPIIQEFTGNLSAKNFILKNVLFEFNKYDLQPSSFTELDQLFEALQKNPEVKVEISGHTDNVGKEIDNQVLSEKRAEAVVNYLVKKGIAKERLSAQGFGESRPIATNNTEVGRMQNRRVELSIE